ncbi:hypothetical protein D9757_011183 [Collybiopsis confluens]|uniref:DUF7918 domain-containing protein n=1 Tax=Collybiopsis confluens TaxID=2823264 RepID=A0A8H5H2Y9_9AGAR|nr:hypothetical protein D9757_011183 [Collybiopsis confluens]
MLFYGEFGAWVTVDGKTLDEFGLDTDIPQRKVSCYIASEEGKSFQVHWYDKEVESATRGRVSIDGRSMGGKIIHSKIDNSVTKRGFRTSAKKRMPFIFSKIQLTDKEDGISYLSTHKPGEINIVIVRVRMTGVKIYAREHTVPETLTYNEEKLKGSTHNTTFGQPAIDTNRILYHETEPYGDPVARFCFRYMPIDLLRAKDIAPYPPRKRRRRMGEEDVDVKPDLKPDLAGLDKTNPGRSFIPNQGSSSDSLQSNGSSRGSSLSTIVSSPAHASLSIKRERIDSAISALSSFTPSRQRSARPGPPNLGEIIDLTNL